MEPSLDELMQGHEELLEHIDMSGASSEEARQQFLTDVLSFVTTLQTAGGYIANPRQRDQLRKLLSFWGSKVYELTETYPNIKLDPSTQVESMSPSLKILTLPIWLWAPILGIIVLLVGLIIGTEIPLSAPTPAATPANTLVPLPPVHISNVKDGDTVAQFLLLVGEYDLEITDDIWVFVGLPEGDLYWPQSPNACEGEVTLKHNGKWEVRVGVGSPDDVGRLFEIIVTTADDEASRFLAQTVKTWCQSDGYSGLSQNELPGGLIEHQRIAVRRGNEANALSPDISNTELPGQVSLEGIRNGDTSPQSLRVGGTYTNDVTDRIWVVVYAPDDRYYPQSTNACAGISTIQAGGLWEARINVGGPEDVGKPFDIIVVLANEDVNAIFEARQEEGCQIGSFPGFLFVELPQGIDEKVRVSVIRE